MIYNVPNIRATPLLETIQQFCTCELFLSLLFFSYLISGLWYSSKMLLFKFMYNLYVFQLTIS